MLMIIFGILINFVPVTSYYLGSYIHIPYKDSIRNGSTLEYLFFMGPFHENTTNSTFNIGVITNITYIGEDKYQLDYEGYKLTGKKTGAYPKLLPEFPFRASGGIVKAYEGHKVVNASNELIQFLMPQKPLPGCLANASIHTFPNKFYGYPEVFMCPSPSIQGMYTFYKNRPVALNLNPLNASSIIEPIMPGSYTGSVSIVSVFLGWGNTVPPQDWTGWVRYGVGLYFPLNVGFIIIGILMLIVASRGV
ncbi:hypothetical protein [Thermococcus waiotapuensis]|uniref:Uncharacterized protein n=1 Tax=Thermococcus waiotapuensis TaxID=90909 RepID=A0AAE4NX44_9EURY|nr:hypothetical protein [Thermococcus waiotapuensis]MDV3104824.1 hypothetical protein [Thermococcus waiotapuensis]